MTAFLDKDTLTLIQETAKKSVEPKLIPLPNDPESYLLLVNGDAKPVKAPFVAPPRRHAVESIESFAAAFNRWGVTPTGDATVADASMANIWVDLDSLKLSFFTDEPLRRSNVTLTLKLSPQLLLMQEFASPKSLEQKVLVRMLRHDLEGCVDPAVLAAFRSIDFQKIINARQNIQHEKQSLDSDIVAQVSGEKKPEAFLVDAPIFAMKELGDARCRIGVTIDIDCDNRKFVLQTKPGHLDMAIDDARVAVLTKLQNDLSALGHSEVTILAGTPIA